MGKVPDMVEAHSKVRQLRLPNFMKVRIPVQTQHKVSTWRKYLNCYWVKQLTEVIQLCFPLDFHRNIVLKSTEVNRNSTLNYSDNVSKYISEKSKY